MSKTTYLYYSISKSESKSVIGLKWNEDYVRYMYFSFSRIWVCLGFFFCEVNKKYGDGRAKTIDWKSVFKVEKKVKCWVLLWLIWIICYFRTIMLTWNDIKDILRWEKLQLSLLGNISVIKMNVLPKM